jgi:hypothetical protein
MAEEEKNQYPWLTALKDERDKTIRNHQNRTIQFENPALEVVFGCGLMIIGAGFLASGFLGYFGTIEVGQMAGLLLGVLLIYAGFLFLLSYGYDYGTLSALETVLAAAKSRKDLDAAWLKQATRTEMETALKPVFGSGILSNLLGLIMIIYGLYVADLLLLRRLGVTSISMMAGFAIAIVSTFGGLSFFMVKEPYKRARMAGFKSCLEIIRLTEHAPKPKEDEKGLMEEDRTSAPGAVHVEGVNAESVKNQRSSELESIELHTLDPDDIDDSHK